MTPARAREIAAAGTWSAATWEERLTMLLFSRPREALLQLAGLPPER